jgi:nicotinate-nucleotide pyrophosphorylase (carboxylating)
MNINIIAMDDIDRFLMEDLDMEGDITSNSLFTNEIAKAHIIANEICMVSGLEELEIVFKKTGCNVKLNFNDGDLVNKGNIVAEVFGKIRSILKSERLALNFVCKLSGITTETKKLVDKCRAINPNVTIAATRKTTPGFRKYEKKAVVLGGGYAHRYGLFDVVLIKDNHLKYFNSIEKVIKKIKKKVTNKIIEIEVENEEDACIAAKMNVDVIMLDNFNPQNCEKIAKKIRKINSNVLIEISGGITPDNILQYAAFADRISLGYITHSIKAKDFSLIII